jgi:heat shock protein HslJ
MRYFLIAFISFFSTSVKSQAVVTILGDWKLVELREVKEPHLSQARNRNPNAKIWYLDDETLPKVFYIKNDNHIKITGNKNKLKIVGNSGCNNFISEANLLSDLIGLNDFEQIDFLFCEKVDYESNYFKMLSGAYDVSFIYKIKGNKLYFYIDKSNGRYNNFRNLTFSNNSQKVINSFFDNPLAIFERIN